MKNEGQVNSQELKIQGLLDRYLRFRSQAAATNPGHHLDEDSLNAFVEGKLNSREASPVLKHLIDCSYCLNVTTELAKLEFDFAETGSGAATASIPELKPTKVSDVLNGLLSRIFGNQDNDAVFAHHQTEDNQETKTPEDEKEA